MTQAPDVGHAVPVDMTPGWHLHVMCVVCSVEAQFSGYLWSQAVEAAERAGWIVDSGNIYAAAHDRYATCPDHSKDPESPRH